MTDKDCIDGRISGGSQTVRGDAPGRSKCKAGVVATESTVTSLEPPSGPRPLPVVPRHRVQLACSEQTRKIFPYVRTEATQRRDPLNNPSDRRSQPVSGQDFQGALRTRKGRDGGWVQSENAGSPSTPSRGTMAERVTITLQDTPGPDQVSTISPFDAQYDVLSAISQVDHDINSAISSNHLNLNMNVNALQPASAPSNPEHSIHHDAQMNVPPASQITIHVDAEARLFEPDGVAIASGYEQDDNEVMLLLQPRFPGEASSMTAHDPATALHGPDNSGLVRKRLLDDDGSDLHGRDTQFGRPCPMQPSSSIDHNSGEYEQAMDSNNRLGEPDYAIASPDASGSPPPFFPTSSSADASNESMIIDTNASEVTQGQHVESNQIPERQDSDSDIPMPSITDLPSSESFTHSLGAHAEAEVQASSKVVLLEGRRMVDVEIFNRTMHYFGKQAFLDGYEEARAMTAGGRSESNFNSSRNLASTNSSSSKSGAGALGNDGGDGSDDDSPGLKGRKSRKSTGKRSPNEVLLMQGIRAFLKLQGLNHEKGGSFPLDVASADVEKFISEGNSAGPKLFSKSDTASVPIRLEWIKSTHKSPWNARAVSILSAELFRILQAGEMKNVTFDAKTMTQKFCEKQIVRRLDRVRRDRIAHEEDTLKEAQRKIDQTERRRGRRKTRNANRLKTSRRKAKGGCDAIWADAQKVIETLTIEGQSGDETESEDVFGHRVVRRLRRPWLNQEISSLLFAIDTYFMEVKDQAGTRKRGNLGLTRHTTAASDDSRPHMVKLPVNFYDSDWYRRLDPYEKAELAARPPMNIPLIEHYVRM